MTKITRRIRYISCASQLESQDHLNRDFSGIKGLKLVKLVARKWKKLYNRKKITGKTEAFTVFYRENAGGNFQSYASIRQKL